MTIFLLCAVLLLALAISFLVSPLLRGGTRATGRDRAIVSPRRVRPRMRETCATAMNVTIAASDTTVTSDELTHRFS